MSLLPVCSKILEKVIVNQINEAMERFNCIPETQFGFKRKTSTVHANIKLINMVTKELNESKKVGVVLIDVKKAFDSCNHEIICSKIKAIGGGVLINNWIKNYLNNREQFVSLSNMSSEKQRVTLGVVQGSVLGPLLFKI